jgi:ligand-binding SRPBCC domain-containing protein
MKEASLRFESKLFARPEDLWSWITSAQGITSEIMPFMKMTMPRGLRSLQDFEFVPGRRLFRSYLLLGGWIPMDYSDLTLLQLKPNEGFIEQSPMASMLLWRHERWIRPDPQSEGNSMILVDELTFQPRFAAAIVRFFVRKLFEHRHQVLRRQFARKP